MHAPGVKVSDVASLPAEAVPRKRERCVTHGGVWLIRRELARNRQRVGSRAAAAILPTCTPRSGSNAGRDLPGKRMQARCAPGCANLP
jgi:hypothetical protein